MAINTLFKNIADAIREKAGTSGLITPAQMPAAIATIQSGLETISRADWNALTTAQKQAKGLIAIIDAVTGYERGQVVNGADYRPSSLPYSDPSQLLCEADYTMPIVNNTIGTGPRPLVATGCSIVDDSIYVPVAASNAALYSDLLASNTPFTAYCVMKLINPGQYTRLLGCMNSRMAGQGMLVYGSNINISSWADDTATGFLSSTYQAIALKYSTSGSGGMVYGSSWISKAPTNSGRYLSVGQTDIDTGGTNREPGNANLKFMGVVNAAEDLTTIQNNLAYIANMYLS